MIEAEGGLSPQVREVLGAYLGASLLADGFQTELWREARLTLAQLAVLRSLRDGGPRTAGHLAEAAGLSAASATRLFDRLEERGAWSAVTAGTTTGAASRSTSPPRGRQFVGAVRVLRDSPCGARSEAMTEAEQRTLAAAPAPARRAGPTAGAAPPAGGPAVT